MKTFAVIFAVLLLHRVNIN